MTSNSVIDRLAVIDIGSNSIRYGEADRGFTRPMRKEVFTTRLGRGLADTGLLAEDTMEASMAVLQSLKARSEGRGIPAFAYATAAVRDAANGAAFAERIRRELRLPVEILPGETEAACAYDALGRGCMIDIGGGSSQIITADYRKSFPLGCVRLKDRLGEGSLEGLIAKAAPLLAATYGPTPIGPQEQYTGVGGTITTLGALSLGLQSYDASRLPDCRLTRAGVYALLQELDRQGDELRSKHPLLRKRHDVIIYGGILLLHLMDLLDIPALAVSDADGMEGYARRIFRRSGEPE